MEPEAELRATTNFYDGVIDQLQAQLSTRATDAGSTAALESCAGQLSRAFMGATVEGPDMVTSAITPGVLGQIGRDLIRGGASLWRIDTAGGRVRLFEAADWYWFQGRDSDPAGWRVRLTTYGPSGSETRVMPWDSVCWFTFGRSTATPWVGRGPASWAPLTAKLAAEAERTLGDEAGGPIANLVPVPQDAEPDDDGNSKFDGLTGDISAARGRALLLETTYAGHGEGRASAPQRDWVASRLGPNPPASMVEAARDSFARMVAACGSNVSLFSDADGTAQREALRRWHMGTVLPLARLVEHELTAKLETPVSLRFDLHATDLAGRAGAFKGLVWRGHGNRAGAGRHRPTDRRLTMTLDARSCETCGAEYTPKVAWQKYCSPRCKNRSKIRRAFKARYTAQNRARLTAYNTAYQRERRARIKAQKADGQ